MIEIVYMSGGGNGVEIPNLSKQASTKDTSDFQTGRDYTGKDTSNNRPTSDEDKKFRDGVRSKLKRMSMDDIHEFVSTRIPYSLEAIGYSNKPPRDIANLYEEVKLVIGERSLRLEAKPMEGSTDEVNPEAQQDDRRLAVAEKLLHAVAYGEGLLGSTDEGIPQWHWTNDAPSLATKVWQDMDSASKILSETPDILGPSTQKIYNNIRTRLDGNPSLAKGNRPVNMKEFPPFPVSTSLKK